MPGERLARGTGTQSTPVAVPQDPARLSAVVRHPDYDAAMAYGPPGSSWLDLLLPLVMVVTGALAAGATFAATGPGLAAALVITLGLPWFVAAVALGRDAWRDRGGLLRRHVSLVVLTVAGGCSPNDGNRTVELLLESGRRHELRCHPGLAAALDVGDVGVAYVKAGRLIAFCRLDV